MFEWSLPYSPIWYVVAAIAVACLVVAARRIAISSQLRRWLLFVPRVGVMGALLLVLMNPVRRTEVGLPDQPAIVDFLVDGSRSMALDGPEPRAAAAQRVIQQVEGGLTGPTRPRTLWYRFGRQLSAAADASQLQPIDDSTQLSAALEQLAGRFSRDVPKAIVVFSDGTIEDAERLDEVAAGYRRLQIPVHVFPLGDPRVRGDVAIQDLVVPPRVEANAKVPIRGAVRGQGYSGERVVVNVRSVDRPQAPPVATLPLTLDGGVQPFELVVEASPDLGPLVLEVPPLAGEASERNNRVPFQLAGKSRKLKVIYMEGTGGNEYAWVRDALQEDKDIECLPMVADQQYVQRPRLIRIGDPQRGFPTTREELLQYDCVICSDISLGAFTREQLEWTVELVAERGGGFMMVGGITSFGAGGWDQTAWDKLIPIDMAGGTLGQGWLYHQFSVKIPPDVESHPIWRIVEDPVQNRGVLARMPPFLGTNYMHRLKPAATVLGVSDHPIPGVNAIMPIFACQSYGKGRTFAFAPDTTADWGRYFESRWGEGDNRYFRRFWRNAVRWLTENSEAGNQRVQVAADRVIYRLGQPIQLTAHAFDSEMRETTEYQLTARVRVEDATANGAFAQALAPFQTVLLPVPGQTGYAVTIDSQSLAQSIDLSALDTAVLIPRTLEVTAMHQGKEVGKGRVNVQLLPDSRELDQPQATRATLETLAKATGGQVFQSPEALATELGKLPVTPGDRIVARSPVWDHPLLWTAILGLLAVEWTLRRRAGYG